MAAAHYSNLAAVRKPTAPALKAEAARERDREAALKRAIDRADRVLARLEARQAQYDAAAKRAKARKEAACRRAQAIEDRIIELMQAAGLAELAGHRAKLSIRANAPAVEVEALDQIPPEYLRVKTVTEADKVAIKCALQKGADVAGVRLVQTLTLLRK